MENPLINILTRTSNRPNAFDLNKTSIRTQTYKNVRHIVSVDDDKTKEYVLPYSDVDMIVINRDEIIANDTSIDPKTGKYSPHNLYFNEMLKEVKEGWIMILDDDDRLSNGKALEKIVSVLPDEDTMAIWQMRFPQNIALPPTNMLDKPPVLGRIGSPCILFHSKHLGDLKWDGWKCGDFRFIKAIYNRVPNKVSIPEMLVTIGQIGDGKRNDL